MAEGWVGALFLWLCEVRSSLSAFVPAFLSSFAGFPPNPGRFCPQWSFRWQNSNSPRQPWASPGAYFFRFPFLKVTNTNKNKPPKCTYLKDLQCPPKDEVNGFQFNFTKGLRCFWCIFQARDPWDPAKGVNLDGSKSTFVKCLKVVNSSVKIDTQPPRKCAVLDWIGKGQHTGWKQTFLALICFVF